jgi:hypothetical protein
MHLVRRAQNVAQRLKNSTGPLESIGFEGRALAVSRKSSSV